MPIALSRFTRTLFAAFLIAVFALCLVEQRTASAAPPAPPAAFASAVLTPTLPFTRALDMRGADFPYLQAADGGAFNLDPAGMTIEFWVEIPAGYKSYTDIVRKPDAYEVALAYEEGWLFFYFDQAGVNGGNTLLPGWHHLAVIFYVDGTKQITRQYIDGRNAAGGIGEPPSFDTSNRPLRVTQGARLRIDELRYSSVVRYPPSNFTPPTEPFACDADTLALWRFDEEAGARVYRSDCGLSADLTPAYELMLPFAAKQ